MNNKAIAEKRMPDPKHGNKFQIQGGVTSYKPWLDVYKGLAIILVVLGHLEISSHLYRYIFSFHMYLFYFAAGLTFFVKKEQSFVKYLKRSAVRLLIPYLVFAMMWNITNAVTQMYLHPGSVDLSFWGIFKNIADLILGDAPFESTMSIGPAWFLLSLFFARAVFWFLVKLTKNNKIILFGCVSVLFVLGYLCNGRNFFPFKIISTLTGFMFFYLGYIFRDFSYKIEALKSRSLLALAVIGFFVPAVVSRFADRDLILVANNLPKDPINTLICGIFGCFGLLFLSLLVNYKIVVKLLSYYGKNSLIIMGVHSEIHFLSRFVLQYIGIPVRLKVVIILVITLAAVVPIIYILNRFFPSLVGKTKNKVVKI